MLKKLFNLTAVIEQDENGFFAFAPELQGCYTQGQTYEEAVNNLREAARAHLLDRLADKQDLPVANEMVSLSRLEIVL